jgi:hypothetical protein
MTSHTHRSRVTCTPLLGLAIVLCLAPLVCGQPEGDIDLDVASLQAIYPQFPWDCLAFDTPQAFEADTKAEIERCAASLGAGDTLTIKNGTYTDVELRVEANGTSSKPIVVTAENWGHVTLRGTSTIHLSGQYIRVYGINLIEDGPFMEPPLILFNMGDSKGDCQYCLASHISIRSLREFHNGDGCKEGEKDYKTVYLGIYGRVNTVMYSQFRHKKNCGEMLQIRRDDGIADHTTIFRNHFYDRPKVAKANQFETIRIGGGTFSGTSHAIIEENLFDACNGETEIITIKADGVILRNNTFRNSGGTVSLRHAHNAVISHNVFRGDGAPESGGIRVFGHNHLIANNYFYRLLSQDENRGPLEIHYGDGVHDEGKEDYAQTQNLKVAYNTFLDNASPVSHGTWWGDLDKDYPPVNTVVEKNYFASPDPTAVFINPDNLPHVQRDNQIFAVDPEAFGALLGEPTNHEGAIVLEYVNGIHRPIAGQPYVGAFHPQFCAQSVTSDPVQCDAMGQPLGYALDWSDVGPFGRIYAREPTLIGDIVEPSAGWFYGTRADSGALIFQADIPERRQYLLTARVYAPAGNQNSFYLTAGNVSNITWHLPIDSSPQHVTYATPIEFNIGSQQIRLDVREAFTWVNYIYLVPTYDVPRNLTQCLRCTIADLP